jgi:hypothetical protein
MYSWKGGGTHNENGNWILWYEYLWNADINDWGFSNKIEYTYDVNENLMLKLKSAWDTDISDWVLYLKEEYYYSETSEINEVTNNEAFTIFPNPTSGNLNIIGEGSLNQNVTLDLTNLNGQLIYSNQFYLTNIDHNIILPKLPKGMYLLTIKANNINSTQKIFIE